MFMSMTIVEKILAEHSGREKVEPGDFLMPKVDFVFGNELGTALAIHGRDELLKKGVFDKSRIAVVPDHFTPNRDIAAAEQCKVIREFVKKSGIEHYYEIGRMGIEHVILPEKGLIGAGDLIVGADSHTCTCGALGAFGMGVGSTDFVFAMMLGEIWLRVPETIRVVCHGRLRDGLAGKDIILHLGGILGVGGARYMALEFSGGAIGHLSMDSRFSICNMAVESGAKTAVIEPDAVTENYLKARAKRPWKAYKADPDAGYTRTIDIDATKLDYQIACPDSPANVKGLGELRKDGTVKLDQVFIGSCTNGRIEDLRTAAEILRGKAVHPGVRLIVIPGSQEVYLQAVEEGIASTLVKAGAAIGTPTCGPCIGGHTGLLASGEICLATTNRNFKGRMGHQDSRLYLSGPAVAAASAVLGYIGSPEEIV
jgi:3-isopropylmalate/(R)-2-methylmalate dehydratase large subunit